MPATQTEAVPSDEVTPNAAPANATPATPAKASARARTRADKSGPTEPLIPEQPTKAVAAPAKRAARKATAKAAQSAAPTEAAAATATPTEATPTEATPTTATPTEATPATVAPAKAIEPVLAAPVPAAPNSTEPTQATNPETPAEFAPATPDPVQPQPAQAQPAQAQPAQAQPAHTQPAPAAKAAPHTEAWANLVADPGRAPEFLALAAVQTIGPRAQDWSARVRADYPHATDAAYARLATHQFTRAGSLGSVFGAVAGSYAPIALLGAAAVTHAELVLHLAAAYGLDPTDPQRAADLLVLTRVHPNRADAEAALAAAQQPAYDDRGFTGAAWRLGRMLATHTGVWGLTRLANRYFPGVSLLTAVLTGHASAHTVAARANAYYRQH